MNGYSIFNDAKCSIEDRKQFFLKFQQLIKYFEASRTIVNVKFMIRKSKDLSYKSIKHSAISDSKLEYFNSLKLRVKFNGSFLITNRVFTPNRLINFYIIFEIKSLLFYSNIGFTLRKSLFGAAKLNKNPYPHKCSISGCGISFDVRVNFSLLSGGFDKNVIIFGANLSSSAHFDNKKNISQFLVKASKGIKP